MVSTDLYSRVARFTLRLYCPRRSQLCLLLALPVLIAALELSLPWLIGRLIDEVSSATPSYETAIRFVAYILVAGLALVLFRDAVFRVILYFTASVMSEVNQGSFAKVQRFPLSWHLHNMTGATVRRISRGAWAVESFNYMLFVELVPSLLILLGATTALALHWPWLGVVVGLSLCGFALTTSLLVVGYISPASRVANDLDSTLSGLMSDAISCNLLVKTHATEAEEESRIAKATSVWKEAVVRFWNRSATSGTIQNAMILVLNALLTFTAVNLWAHGRATPGEVAYIISTYVVINGYLRNLENTIRSLQSSINEMQDVAQFAIMDTEFDVPCSDLKPITAAPVAIQFDGVCFTYNERTEPIYTDLNLQIRTGERVGFVGHSGSGKSTAIKLMQRMYSPQMGTVKILGNDAKGLRIAALRRSIAVTGQEPIFFNRSIRENIAYGCESADLDQIRAAAQLAMIDDVIVSLPNGYDTAIGERGLKLSGGERQRIAIARACLSDAQILVFDEATSQVDAETEAALQDKVWSRLASKTIVVVAHRLSQVRNLDRILVFDKGGIAEEGNHETLIARRGLYHRMVMRQSVAQC